MKKLFFPTIATAIKQKAGTDVPVIVAPEPPTFEADDETDFLRFISPLGNSKIEVSINNANPQAQPAEGFDVGDYDLPIGYFKGRIKADGDTPASAWTLSPAFTKGEIVVEPVLAVPFKPGTTGNGDSIGAGIADSNNQGFIQRTFTALGITSYNNLSVSGETSTQQTGRAALGMPFVTTVPYFAEDGINSFKQINDGDYDAVIRDITAGYLTRAAFHFAKSTYFMNTAGFVKSNMNNLADVNQYAGDLGSRVQAARAANDKDADWYYNTSCVANDTIKGTINGSAFAFVVYVGNDRTRIVITVDGVPKVTTIAETYKTGSLKAFPVLGLTDGNHEFEIKALDSGKTFAVDCIVVLKSASETTSTPFYVIDVPKLQEDENGQINIVGFTPTSNPDIVRCSSVRWDKLTTDFKGYNFVRYEINEFYNSQDKTQCVDKIHPIDKGHKLAATGLLSLMDLTGITLANY